MALDFDAFADSGSAADGMKEELGATLDRAREERLRLMRLIKDADARKSTMTPPVPAEKIVRLTEKVHSLELAITDRFTKLEEIEDRIDKRIDQLTRLEQTIAGLTAEFGEQVQTAKLFEKDINAARSRVQEVASEAVIASREQFQQLADQVADRLDEVHVAEQGLVERGETAERQIELALANAVQSLQDQAAAFVEPMMQQVQSEFEKVAAAARQSMREKLEVLDIDTDHLLSPVREQISTLLEDSRSQIDKIGEIFTQKTDQVVGDCIDAQMRKTIDASVELFQLEHLPKHRAQLTRDIETFTGQLADDMTQQQQMTVELISRHVAQIEANFDKDITALVTQSAQRIQQAAGELNEQMDQKIAHTRDAGQHVVEAFERELKEQLTESRNAAASMLDVIENQLARRVESIPRQAEEAAATVERDLRDRLTQLHDNAESMVSLSEKQFERRLEALPKRATETAKQAEADLREQFEAARQQIEQAVSPMRQQLLAALEQVRGGAVEARRALRMDAEPPVVSDDLADSLEAMSQKIDPKPQVADEQRDAA